MNNQNTSVFEKIILRKDVRFADRVFFWITRLIALLLVGLLVSMGLFLLNASSLAIRSSGIVSFVSTSVWDPVKEVYGALPVVYGTLVSSVLSLIIAFPLSIGIALFVNELAPAAIGRIVGFLVEMLAAIPSVIYGLWGVFVLVPFLREYLQPWLISKLGFFPLFEGPAYGVGLFSAGLILSLMIIPTISSISREVFAAIPRGQREAALALGATRWEMMKLSVLESSKAGMFGAMMLGLGRALGETMAVTMVIGNRAQIVASLFAPAQTMSSVIANEYAEATSDLHLSSLALVGLILFVVTFVTSSLARLLVWRVTRSQRKLK
ncbi:MAG: phosphate ABC transporter permease subunit PstC [Proteobacteria bacterium]|nr:phosphate ABC transporter permease subunit PstC [Pseudomonadota bacterium]NDC24752.1 phosphate ABC transporter permease subunit PstC [Pseudomonadota bacterium]NDD04655.1 phosphate ABC transporter permease subunit PstC [Pseudomonadota bacterium]NDG25866.1 phosphate ABC transporter permease subunit PstC [Pseudomonadota bacterium]